MIKKFKEFDFKKGKKSDDVKTEKEKSLEIKKKSNKDGLSNDIENLEDDVKKSDKKVKLDKIEIIGVNQISTTDPLKDNPELKESATIINADLGDKEASRGDILYITAMIKKKNVNWNSMAVIKVRVVDIYQGLSMLNSLR